MLRTVDDCLFDENETLSCFGRDIKGFPESHFLILAMENIVILATAIDRTTKKTITELAASRNRGCKTSAFIIGEASPPEIQFVWYPQFFELASADFVFFVRSITAVNTYVFLHES